MFSHMRQDCTTTQIAYAPCAFQIMYSGPPATSFLFNMLIKAAPTADPRDTAGSLSQTTARKQILKGSKSHEFLFPSS